MATMDSKNALTEARKMEHAFKAFQYVREVLEAVVVAQESVEAAKKEQAKVEAETQAKIKQAESAVAVVSDRVAKAEAEHKARISKFDVEYGEIAAQARERKLEFDKKIEDLSKTIKLMEMNIKARSDANKIAMKDMVDEHEKKRKVLDAEIKEREAVLQRLDDEVAAFKKRLGFAA